MLDDSDCMVECPYNKSHRVQRSRLQTHLFKCRKNYPQMELKRCPYNANHDVEQADIQRHMETCPDRGSVEAHLVLTANERKTVIMPYVAPIMPPEEENWDSEPTNSTYDPSARSSHEKILRGLQGASKSERKAHRAQERLRFTAVAEHGGCSAAGASAVEGTGSRSRSNPPTRAAATATSEDSQAVRQAFSYQVPFRDPLAPSESFVLTAPAVASSTENVVRPPQAWAKRSEATGNAPQGRGNAVARNAPLVTHGENASSNGDDDFVPPSAATGSYRMRISVDTGEGLPAPNLDRDFPILGRGRARLQ